MSWQRADGELDWERGLVGEVAPSLLGSVLAGRYELRERLGSGGVADVYRAVDLSLGRAVAVKVFRPGCGPDVGTESRFATEVWTLAGLQHPNLVTLYDAGAAGDVCYLVLELVRGPTLAYRLRDHGPLPADEVARIGAALAEALACVHAHEILHRDVKPSNVLLDSTGRPYLTDFGIACLLGASGLTATGTLVGTAAYMAPEQVAGHGAQAASDLYALGLVLLECLTGRREYQGSAIEVAVARLHRDPQLPDQLTPAWHTLLTALTARHPGRRPTASEVAARLHQLTAAGPDPETAALPFAAARRRSRPAGHPGPRRQRRGHAVAAAACLTALAVAAPLTARQLTDHDGPGAASAVPSRAPDRTNLTAAPRTSGPASPTSPTLPDTTTSSASPHRTDAAPSTTAGSRNARSPDSGAQGAAAPGLARPKPHGKANGNGRDKVKSKDKGAGRK